MIQAISEIDPDQAIPVIPYIRQHPSTPRDDTAQYDTYVLHPAIKLQISKHADFIQRQQTIWIQEPFESRSRCFRSETLPGAAREYTL